MSTLRAAALAAFVLIIAGLVAIDAAPVHAAATTSVASATATPAIAPSNAVAPSAVLSPASAPRDSIAELSRQALENPASLTHWTRLARALETMRPEPVRDIPTAAERVARQIVDSLAAETRGVIRELRVERSAGRTEVAVAVTGEIRHRLLRRLADTGDPRLTVVLYGADPALLEPLYPAIERGGVRELRVKPTDTGTVEIAIALERPAAFTLARRGDEVVVGIEHGAEFEPWSSRPAWSRNAPQRIDEVIPALAPVAIVGREDGGLLDAFRTAEEESSARASVVGMEGAADPGARINPRAAFDAAAGAIDALTAAVMRVPGALASRGSAVPPWAGEVAAALAVALGGLLVARRVRAARPRSKAAAAPRPKRAGRAAREATGRSANARLGTALSLAEQGAPQTEIARRTGLSRDAVILLKRARRPAPRPAESAGPGTNFRPTRGAAATYGAVERMRKMVA